MRNYAYGSRATTLNQKLQEEQAGLIDIAHNRALLKKAKNGGNYYSEILDQQQITASTPKNGVPKVTLVYDENQITNAIGNKCGSLPHNYEASNNINKIIKKKDYVIFFLIIIGLLVFIGVKK